jgi:hypothetical protein
VTHLASQLMIAPMSCRPEDIIKQAHQRIASVRAAVSAVDYFSSGTLLERMTVCANPGCRCGRDPDGRHDPYYHRGYMNDGKRVHRRFTREQARIVRRAIAQGQEAHGGLGGRGLVGDDKIINRHSIPTTGTKAVSLSTTPNASLTQGVTFRNGGRPAAEG